MADRMEFEFDPNKSRANHTKHGIDFVRSQDLGQDPARVEIPARTEDEPRWLVIGMIDGKHWSAVVTVRQDNVADHLRAPLAYRGGSRL